MGRCDLLIGQSDLQGGKTPILLTSYLPPCCTVVQKCLLTGTTIKIQDSWFKIQSYSQEIVQNTSWWDGFKLTEDEWFQATSEDLQWP